MSDEIDPNFVFRNGEFELLNGDEYSGDYCAHRCGVIWREGLGTYTSKDNHSYTGAWYNDKLIDHTIAKITFPTGEQYRGCTVEDKFSGPGVYTFQNKMDISCVFQNNRPIGKITLLDLEGYIWQGSAGENHAVLLPENIFFSNISETEGMGKLKTKYEATVAAEPNKSQNVEDNKEKVINDKELEKVVFNKSTKTPYNIDFKESKWYQRYLRYETMLESITSKISQNQELSEEEAVWRAKAEKNKKKIKKRIFEKIRDEKKKSVVDNTLLDTFYDKSHLKMCSVMKVFRPTVDTENKNTLDRRTSNAST